MTLATFSDGCRYLVLLAAVLGSRNESAIMQVHAYGMASQGIGPDHPIDLTVNVEKLPAALKAIVTTAISDDILLCYVALDGERWVSRAQLAAAVGFGRKLRDPADPCFVPPTATLTVPYLPTPVTDAAAAASPYQRFALSTAQRAADYLAALAAEMPPRPHDLHVHRTSGVQGPLLDLVTAGLISSFPSDRGWWVSPDYSSGAQIGGGDRGLSLWFGVEKGCLRHPFAPDRKCHDRHG